MITRTCTEERYYLPHRDEHLTIELRVDTVISRLEMSKVHRYSKWPNDSRACKCFYQILILTTLIPSAEGCEKYLPLNDGHLVIEIRDGVFIQLLDV